MQDIKNLTTKKHENKKGKKEGMIINTTVIKQQ